METKGLRKKRKRLVMNEEEMKYLGVRGILADPRLVENCACNTDEDADQVCFDDDSPFPASDDIINSIMRDTFNVELRNIFPEPAVVNVDKVEDNMVKGAE